MGQRWKLLFMTVPMHWAQVWGTMMGQKWGPYQGPQQKTMMGQNWGTELARLPPCPTGTHTQAGLHLPAASDSPDTQGVQDWLWDDYPESWGCSGSPPEWLGPGL